MKNLGILLLVAGCCLGLYAFQMKTTVTTDGRDFGYGISIPSMTVNNIGLMEDRRNMLMASGLMVLVGAIFTALGGRSNSEERTYESTSGQVKCAYCAEMIKAEAIVCRFCGKDVIMPEKPVYDPIKTYEIALDSKNCIQCPLCNAKMRLDAKELEVNQFKCTDCKADIKFSMIAESSRMEKYGITKVGDKYHYGEYKYDSLNDAINYAELWESKNLA